jgi:hypothetical protein
MKLTILVLLSQNHAKLRSFDQGHHDFKTHCVKNSANIHIRSSSFPYPGDVGRHTNSPYTRLKISRDLLETLRSPYKRLRGFFQEVEHGLRLIILLWKRRFFPHQILVLLLPIPVFLARERLDTLRYKH